MAMPIRNKVDRIRNAMQLNMLNWVSSLYKDNVSIVGEKKERLIYFWVQFYDRLRTLSINEEKKTKSAQYKHEVFQILEDAKRYELTKRDLRVLQQRIEDLTTA